ncbi:MAG TPA: hypothetical protein VK335_07535 [Bryobacteraceae bacterium]|nr:hypothetical protein [Bryobacteraceae bacterium]
MGAFLPDPIGAALVCVRTLEEILAEKVDIDESGPPKFVRRWRRWRKSPKRWRRSGSSAGFDTLLQRMIALNGESKKMMD